MTSNAGQREKVRPDERCCGWRRRRRKYHVLSPARTPYPRGKGEEERVIKEGGGRPAGGSGVPRQVGRIYTGLRGVGGGGDGGVNDVYYQNFGVCGKKGKRTRNRIYIYIPTLSGNVRTVLVFIVASKQSLHVPGADWYASCFFSRWFWGGASHRQCVAAIYIARGLHFCKGAFCRRSVVFLRVSCFFEKAPAQCSRHSVTFSERRTGACLFFFEGKGV